MHRMFRRRLLHAVAVPTALSTFATTTVAATTVAADASPSVAARVAAKPSAHEVLGRDAIIVKETVSRSPKGTVVKLQRHSGSVWKSGGGSSYQEPPPPPPPPPLEGGDGGGEKLFCILLANALNRNGFA